jgi:hypothetical protein
MSPTASQREAAAGASLAAAQTLAAAALAVEDAAVAPSGPALDELEDWTGDVSGAADSAPTASQPPASPKTPGRKELWPDSRKAPALSPTKGVIAGGKGFVGLRLFEYAVTSSGRDFIIQFRKSGLSVLKLQPNILLTCCFL